MTAETYTADTVSLLLYLVDSLPPGAGRLYDRAEEGDVLLEIPTVAAVEAVYSAAKGVPVRGVDLAATPADIVAGIERGVLPVVPVPDDRQLLAEIPDTMVDVPSQMHDAMILASHRSRGTEAIITSDEAIDGSAPTVWE